MQNHLARRWVAAVSAFLLASVAGQADAADTAVEAFCSAITKNVDHAREYVEQKDYKSLVQTTTSINLLAELLKARGDDAEWRAATDKILTALSVVQKAAPSENASECSAALDKVAQAVKASAMGSPKGKATALSRVPPIRSLMLTMDATAAEAKIALLTGNVEAAKKQACVLAELARLVSNSRQTDEWSSLAGPFEKATQAVGMTTETDSKAVRQLLRSAMERCDACHEKNRTR